MKIVLVSLLASLFVLANLSAQPSTARDSTWVTNGTVYAVAYSKGIAYIGGDFTYVGPNTWYGAALNTSDGSPNLTFPRVNGPIFVVTQDGSGGWYIGGKFTKVGTCTRNGIAHIKSDGTVDASWDPNATGSIGDYPTYNPIYAIVVSGTTVYVGGNFSSIGGQQRSGVAALSASTGLATSWNPNASSTIRSLAVSGSTVYVGGDFSSSYSNTIGGQRRNYVAAIDVATGNATSWNPAPNGKINALAVSGSSVFIGGEFTNAGGQVRNYIAAIDAVSGTAITWNPNADGKIYVFAISGTTLYAGGDFTTVGGLVRNKAVALSTSSSTPLSWNPNANGAVRSIYVSGSTIYVCGDFTSIGGQFRNYIASLDATNGNATTWNSLSIGTVRGMAIGGSVLYAGGDFRSIGGQVRNRLAAIDARTGFATAWNPDVNGRVWEITPNGSTIYVGGEFTQVAGQPRNHIVAIDSISGNPTLWNPNSDGNVYAIAMNGSIVYVGGGFYTIGGQSRYCLAAIDVSTGGATVWNPNVNSSVTSILVNGSTVFIGGNFSSVGGQSRNALAAIDATAGTVLSWNPSLNSYSTVRSMALDGSNLYFGGSFTSVQAQVRNRLAAVDITTAVPTGWNPNANNNILTMAISGATLYVGGNFTNVGGYTRNYLASIDKTTGIPNSWSPDASGDYPDYGSGQSLSVIGSTVFVGGTFKSVGGEIQDYFAQYGEIPNPVPTISSASPTSGNRLQTLSVTINGTEFVSGKTSVSFGSGVTINSVTLNSSTQLIANITIGPTATTGNHDITVTNSPPGGGTATLFNGFTVNNPAPTLTSISPTSGNRLQTLNVVFTGSNFISGVSTVNPGSNITVNSVSVNSSTQLTANITISAAAATGANNFSVSNATPGGGTSSSQAFTVNNPLPTLSSISPSIGNRLQSLNVVFTGTNFIGGVTTVNPGSNITVNSVTVNSSTQLTANITISAAATTGANNFSVSNATPGGGTSASQTFTVNNPAPTLSSISPSVGNRLQSLNVVFSGTNFISGMTTANVGTGITINSTTVNRFDSLTVNITISANAPTGARNFSVTNATPGGGTSANQTFTVFGAVVSISSLSINLGNVGLGQFKDTAATITNTGNDTLKIDSISSSNAVFSVRPTNRILLPSQSFSDTIRYTPVVIGVNTGNILVYSNATSSPDTVKVSGFGAGVATLQLNTAAVPFGNVKVGQFKDTAITITNSGNDTLKISNIASSSASFSARPTTKNIPPSQSITDTLRFTAIAIGPASGSTLVYSNARSSPDTIKATGYAFGTGKLQLSMTMISYGNVKLGQYKDTTVVITNIGNDTLKISNIASSNASFSARPTVKNIPPSQSFTDTLRFTPIALGTASGSILVYSNAASSPDTIKVSGSSPGTAVLQPNTTVMSFGSVFVGQSKKDSITVKNIGTDSLIISTVASTNTAFTITPTSARLDTSASTEFYVTFNPNSAGAKSGYLIFTSNVADVADSVTAIGNGLSAASIAEARKDANSDLIPDHSVTKDTLLIYGIITSLNFQPTQTAYFVQDSSAGIQVFNSNTIFQAFAIGDSVFSIGTVQQYRGLTEFVPLAMDSAHFGYLKHNATVPKPKRVPLHTFVSNPENYEGLLIELDTLYKASGTWPASGVNGSVYLRNAAKTDTVQMFIGLDTNIDGTTEPTYPINVVGIASQYSSDFTALDNGYEIIPRDTNDYAHISGLVKVNDLPSGIPTQFELGNNYPNPFNPSTQIDYSLPRESFVALTVYNTLGQIVATLVNEMKAAGHYSVRFGVKGLPSGIYFYRLQASEFVQTKKLVVLK